MPTAPDLEAVKGYLGTAVSSYTDTELQSALDAETAAQGKVCKIKDEWTEYPADLAEALFRRVHHNLALRGLPLGVQATITEAAVATNSVGGTDAEVRRLEGPYRKRIVG